MRTLKAMLGLVVLFVLMSVSPAQAWWDWLDNLSGPGKFSGPQFQFRLMCFGGQSAAKKPIDDLKRASDLVDKLRSAPDSSVDADAAAAAEAWRDFVVDLNTANRRFPVLDPAELRSVVTAVETMNSVLLPQPNKQNKIDRAAAIAALQAAEEALRPPVTTFVRTTAALNSTSMIVSGCSPNTERRTSLDVAVSFLHADGDQAFAGGEEIRLTMLMPLFSFRVLHDPRYDMVDAGVGGGVYWFTSKGFASFSGVVLQPGYLDFHAPTNWTSGDYLQRVLGAFSFRYGVIVFPGGFAADAFAGTGSRHVQIPGELIKTWGLFWTIDPYVHGGSHQ